MILLPLSELGGDDGGIKKIVVYIGVDLEEVTDKDMIGHVLSNGREIDEGLDADFGQFGRIANAA
jgi:hypothetical protein